MAHLLVLLWKASEKKTTVQDQQGHNAMQKLLASHLVPWNQSQSQSQNNLPPQSGSQNLLLSALWSLRQALYGPWLHMLMLEKPPSMMRMGSSWMTKKMKHLSHQLLPGRHPQPDPSQTLPNPPQSMTWPMTPLLPLRLVPIS